MTKRQLIDKLKTTAETSEGMIKEVAETILEMFEDDEALATTEAKHFLKLIN